VLLLNFYFIDNSSGFSELARFIRYFRPRKIIPTVGVGSAGQRKKMDDTFNEWLSDRKV